MLVTLTNDNYESAIDGANMIIDFSATWCGPCKRMEPEYEAAEEFVKEIGLDLTFASIDVDDAEEAAEAFGISAIPTLILIKDGKIVSKNKGAMNRTKILTFIGAHFDVNKKEEKKTRESSEPRVIRKLK